MSGGVYLGGYLPVGLRRFVPGPIDVAFPATPLHQVGDHDDDVNILLPNHPPERVPCVLKRALSGDVGVAFPEPINEVGVDVVRSLLLAHQGRQLDPGVVVSDDVEVSVLGLVVRVAGVVVGGRPTDLVAMALDLRVLPASAETRHNYMRVLY